MGGPGGELGGEGRTGRTALGLLALLVFRMVISVSAPMLLLDFFLTRPLPGLVATEGWSTLSRGRWLRLRGLASTVSPGLAPAL